MGAKVWINENDRSGLKGATDNTFKDGDRLPGKVNMLPSDKYQDPVLAKMELKKILDYDFDILLVGDGESIIENAKETVESYFES